MLKEVDIAGIYLPPMALYLAVAVVIFLVLRRGLDWIGAGRLLWHRPLCDLALFVSILSLLVHFF